MGDTLADIIKVFVKGKMGEFRDELLFVLILLYWLRQQGCSDWELLDIGKIQVREREVVLQLSDKFVDIIYNGGLEECLNQFK